MARKTRQPQNAGRRSRRIDPVALDQLPRRLRALVDEFNFWVPPEELQELIEQNGEDVAYEKITKTLKLEKSRLAFEEYGPDHPDADLWNEERDRLRTAYRAHAHTVMVGLGLGIERSAAEARRPKGMTDEEFERQWQADLPEATARYEARLAGLAEKRRLREAEAQLNRERNRAEIGRLGLSPPVEGADGRLLAVRRRVGKSEVRVLTRDQADRRRGLLTLCDGDPWRDFEIGHALGRGGKLSRDSFIPWVKA